MAQAKTLFQKGQKIIPIKVDGNIQAVLFPKKFLELVVLKKLKGTDSALSTKTKDFVIVPNTLDSGQLSK